MNLTIISENKGYNGDIQKLNSIDKMIKINGEYLIERIIRIGRSNGIEKVFCIINSDEQKLKHYLSTNNFGIPVKLFVQDTENALHSLFVLAPFIMKEPFFLVSMNTVFSEYEFSEFVTYSSMQEDADGIIAVTRNINIEKPLAVAMNELDIILKFNNSKEGYSWVNGNIYYFSSNILKETNYAFQSGISDMEKFLQFLIVKGYILKGFSFSRIIKVNNVTDIAKAEELLKSVD